MNIDKKKIFVTVCLISVIAIFLGYILTSKKDSSYPYVFINGNYYYVTNEPADKNQIDASIGTVKRITEIQSTNMNGDSNCLVIDSQIYSVKSNDKKEDAPLIVSRENDKYVMAYIYHSEAETL